MDLSPIHSDAEHEDKEMDIATLSFLCGLEDVVSVNKRGPPVWRSSDFVKRSCTNVLFSDRRARNIMRRLKIRIMRPPHAVVPVPDDIIALANAIGMVCALCDEEIVLYERYVLSQCARHDHVSHLDCYAAVVECVPENHSCVGFTRTPCTMLESDDDVSELNMDEFRLQ